MRVASSARSSLGSSARPRRQMVLPLGSSARPRRPEKRARSRWEVVLPLGRRARPRRQVAPPLRRPDRREFFSSGCTQVMPSPVSTKISRCGYLIGNASEHVMSVARKGEVVRGGGINQWIWSTVGVTRSITVSSRAALTLQSRHHPDK